MTTTTASPARRRAVTALAGLVLAVTATVVASPAPVAAAAPTPTPARVGKPTSMAALGDSITQSTGTGELGQENPKNSWSTGTDIDSVRARLGISPANTRNLSANGARMGNADDQVVNGRDGVSLSPTTQYVTIEMGGNDLCRDSVADMTATATYRTQLEQALAAIRTRAPEALVFVMSVPDIYNLWYIRGAPQHGTYHPEPESDQATGGNYVNGARFYWGQSFFPCQSLLSNPGSYADADRARRNAVRQRTIEYNAALEAECAEWLRCRYDDDRLFDMTSNRATPGGPLLPHSQWNFTDAHISRNEGVGVALCPAQGLVSGGCGDHFHPSKAGQGKLADVATVASYDWSDTTAPTAGLAATTAPRGDGSYKGPVSIAFTGADTAGLRGQEVRVHRPDGSVTAWDQSIGVHPAVSVTELGTSYVEVRSLDVNGNLSASKILAITVKHLAPSATGTPATSVADGSVNLTWTAPFDDGGGGVSAHDVERTDPAGGGTTTTIRVGSLRQHRATVPNGRVSTFRVRAVNSVGPGPWSAATAPALPPFAKPVDFVSRMYTDLALRTPAANEAASAANRLITGASSPAQMAAGLINSTTWEGTISPVVRLYQAYYLRYPEAGGLAYWEGRRRGGLSIHAMAQLFSGTPEFRTLYGSLSNRAFVRQVYLNVLDREPDAAGWDYWTAELDQGRINRGRMMIGYSESAENKNATRTMVMPVVIWWGLLERLPTAVEHDDAATFLAEGGTTTELVEQIITTSAWADHVT